jgi:general secretion pathway protein I
MRQRGFTLVEVMLALGILFAGLVMLISKTASNIRISQESQALGVATELARGKMYDIEEILLDEGFMELDGSEEGDFAEEGWPKYTWKAEIIKIELPALNALDTLENREGQEEGGEVGAGGGLMGPTSPLGGLLGMGGGDDASAMAGASFISSQFELFTQVLEASIRKVTLTVKWRVANHDQELAIVCYFTEPAAMNRVIAGGTGYVDDEDSSSVGSGDDSRDSSDDSSSTTKPSKTRGITR